MVIKMKKCVVCKSTIERGDYCDAHKIAKKNIEKRFKTWQSAYGDLSWEDYLKKLIEDEEIPVGDWAKEVADYCLKNDIKFKK